MNTRKRTNISLDPKYILIGIIVICIIGIIVSFKFNNQITPVRNGVTSVISPMQKGINNIGVFISEKVSYITTMKKLMKENKSLKSQMSDLSAQNKLLQQDKYELKNFRSLYDLDEEYADYPKVAARVVSSDPDNWYNTFVIDKGSKDGIKKNMNVMANDGLVGLVTEVNSSYSKVRSIIDDDSNLAGTFLKTSDSCIVSGNLTRMNEGVIDISNVSANAKVKDGYEVVTSQISSKYLPGILIGYARDIKVDSSNMTMSGSLTPAVDFSSLDMVLVITKVKDTEDLEDMLN